MSAKPELKSSGKFDGLLWFLVLLLVSAGVGGNVYFGEYALLYRVVALIALGVAAAFVAMQTVKGGNFWTLLKEAKAEIRKVVWPTRPEVLQTTLIVVVVVLVMGLILWALDSLLSWGISSLIE